MQSLVVKFNSNSPLSHSNSRNTIHRDISSASYLSSSRRQSPQVHRSLRPQKKSKAPYALVLLLLACVFVFAASALLAKMQFTEFRSAIQDANSQSARVAYEKGNTGFVLKKRYFKRRIKGYVISTYKDGLESNINDSKRQKTLKLLAPFQSPAGSYLSSLITDMRRDFDQDRNLLNEFSCALYYAKPLASNNQEIAREYDMGSLLVNSQRAFLKGQSLERKKYSSLDALKAYEQVAPEDTHNFKNAQKKIADLKKRADVDLIAYNGRIYHIFSHCLIAWPGKAGASQSAKGYDIDCITVPEFKRMIEQLYENNYMLVDANVVYKAFQDGSNGRPKLMFPKGKKPLILSVDDVTYDPRKSGNGMVDKLILKDGKIYTYTKGKNTDTGKDVISDDNEVFPILEKFIAQHPDFSFKGGRANLAMTGFIGCFGYRTDRLAKNQSKEIPKAQEIARALKSLGYSFASHSYSHHRSAQVSFAKVKDDSQKWKNETEPIVGATKLYFWPYGESVKQSDAKVRLLRSYGFRVFDGVGSGGYTVFTGKALMQDRAPVDGYSLRHREETYKKMFDCRTVFDDANRNIIYPQGGGVQ